MSTITIRLDHSRAARPLPPDSQLQLEVIKAAMGLIKQTLVRASSLGPHGSDERLGQTDRLHHNIGLLGGRGAGKTSVLLSLLQILDSSDPDPCRAVAEPVAAPALVRCLEQIKDDDKLKDVLDRLNLRDCLIGGRSPDQGGDGYPEPSWRRIAERVSVATLVEPSMLERGDHLVVTVFGALWAKGKQALERRPPTNAKGGALSDRFARRAAAVCDQLLPIVLSEGLLEGIYAREGKAAVHKKFREDHNERHLDRAMTEFVEAYLEIVQKELVVVALDDVDLVYDRGEEVLEALRRYLASPRIVILVTGDLGLFTSSMRIALQRKASGPGRVNTAWYGKPSLQEDDIDEMVEQHLKKVLPAHLRLFLRTVDELPLDEVQIEGRASSPQGGVPFRRHFADVVRACFLAAPSRPAPREEEQILERFRFLIPRDVRHFVELCSIDPGRFDTSVEPQTDDDDDGNDLDDPAVRVELRERRARILEAFLRVWQGDLPRFGAGPARVAELIRDRQVGRAVLNQLVREERFTAAAIHLDPRTEDRAQNVALAFLRFAMEVSLARRPVCGPSALALDFFVPATYLARLPADRRETMRQDFGLWLHDSHRRLYHRIVAQLGRERDLQPAIIPLCDTPGQMARLLDIHDASWLAEWRLIPRAAVSVTRTSIKTRLAPRAQEYLAGPTAQDDSPSASGWDWTTRYLRDFSRHWGAADWGLLPDSAGEPLACEMVTTPRLFDELAGALPRLVLQCWTVREGERVYLSPWKAVSLMQRILARLEELDARSTTKSQLHAAVRRALFEHVGQGAATVWDDQPSGTRREDARIPRPLLRSVEDLAEEVRRGSDPLALYPGKTRKVSWRDPPPPGGDSEEAAWPEQPSSTGWKLWGSWFEDDDPGGAPTPLTTTYQLQAARLRAWDAAVDRLAWAIAEWAIVWGPRLRTYGDKRRSLRWSRLDQIEAVIATFFEDLGDDAAFAGASSGAGDIIQRWVLSFLNAVLTETLVRPNPKDGAETTDSTPPALRRLSADTRPVRRRRPGTGCGHPLYENLARLRAPNHGAHPDPKRDWTWSEVFVGMASFPLFSMFLPGGGESGRLGDAPLPPVKDKKPVEMKEQLEDLMSDVALDPGNDPDIRVQLRWITCFGALMLLPLPEQTEDRLAWRARHRHEKVRATTRGWSEDATNLVSALEHGSVDAATLGDARSRWGRKLDSLRESLSETVETLARRELAPRPSRDPRSPTIRTELRRDREDLMRLEDRVARRQKEVEQAFDRTLSAPADTSRLLHELASLGAWGTFPLDLAGLSWRGLDLVHASEGKPTRVMDHVEARRSALVAMLNSVIADIPIVQEAEEHLAALTLAVHQAMKDQGTKVQA